MNQVISKEQFEEFMNQIREDNQRRTALIAKNGRMIDKMGKEIHKTGKEVRRLAKETHELIELINRIPVFSVYKDGKLIKKGGVR